MIFVTGGTGVLGSQLLYDLTKENVKIKALYRSENKIDQLKKFFQHFNPTTWEDQFNRIQWVRGDVLDITSLEEHMRGCDYVYHLAAMVSFYSGDFAQMMKINREGTANVVNFSLHYGIKKMCYVSSTAAIGENSGAIINEDVKWKNTPTTTGYSQSKYAAEKEVWRGIEEGLNAVMVNPCVILGAGNWNESSLTVFKTVKKGTMFYPPGSNSTVDARDVSSIMIKLLNSEIHSERFLCIGSNQPFEKLMTVIAEKLGSKKPSIKAPRWLVNFGRMGLGVLSFILRKKPTITKETVEALYSHRSYDASKVKKALNYEFKPFEETVEFAVNNRLV